MVKDISTLVDDIHSLFDKGGALDGAPLGSVIADVVQSRFVDYSKQREPTLRMSNIGRPLRQLWFELSGREPDTPLSPTAKIKFMYGDILEALLLFLAEMAGHTVELRQREVKFHGVVGHIDAIIDGWLVDAKSAASQSYLKFKTGSILKDDPFGYVFQISGYWQALRSDNVLLHGAGFLAVDKQFGHICFCPIDNEILNAQDVAGRIEQDRFVAALRDPPPEYCYDDVPDGSSGNMRVGAGCSYCSYLHQCRDGLRTYLYSTGPKYLTKVVKEPRVPEFVEFDTKEN